MKNLMISALMATSAMTLTSAAYAQIEEIIVTAQKREQAITDVSASVAAFDGDTVRSLGVKSPTDVSMMISNVDIKNSSQGDVNPAITVRGIGMNNFNSNNNPSVGVYIDDVFMSSPSMLTMLMMDVERIEVLKGPQGTLYGRNSSGGAIKIISARPTSEPDGFINVTAANYSSTRIEGALGGPLGDKYAWRVSALKDTQGESYHFNRLTDSDFGDRTSDAVRAQLAFQGEATDWNLSLFNTRQDGANSPAAFDGTMSDVFAFDQCAPIVAGNFGYELDPASCVSVLGYSETTDKDPFTHDMNVVSASDLQIDTELSGAIFEFNHDFENVTFTSITGYMKQDRVYGENAWSTPDELFSVVHDEEIKQISQELRLAGGTDDIDYIAGLFYSKDSIDAVNVVSSHDLVGLAFGSDFIVWDIDQETTAYAAFGNVDFHVNDEITVIGGIRASHEETSFAGGTAFPGWAAAPLALADSGEVFAAYRDGSLEVPSANCVDVTFACTGYNDADIEEDNISFKLAVEYRPNDDNLIYGSVGTGFKSGGFFGDFVFAPEELEPFDSETVTSYEVGHKWSFADGRAQLNSALFVYNYENMQTLFPSAIGFRLANMEEARITGIDVELIAAPNENWDFVLGAGWIDSEAKSAVAAYDGNRLPNTAEFQSNGLVRYERPFTENFSLALQANYKYSGDTFKEATNDPLNFADAYNVINAQISLVDVDQKWELSLWARNIADEQYFTEVFAVEDPIGGRASYSGAPLTWGLTFNMDFH